MSSYLSLLASYVVMSISYKLNKTCTCTITKLVSNAIMLLKLPIANALEQCSRFLLIMFKLCSINSKFSSSYSSLVDKR